MTPRDLVLLSPYRLPAQYPLTLADEDMAAWLHGYAALWHPAALWGSAGPARVDSPYDHENPKANHVYAVPASPPSLLPDDWEQRVRAAGAVCFKATADRAATLANLKAALEAAEETRTVNARLADLEPATAAPFLALGTGYMLLAALSEAMEHENLLDSNDFWIDVQLAIAAAAELPLPPRPKDP